MEGYPTLDAAAFLAEAPLQMESRSDTARQAEAAFDLAPCVYFYVGWSHPSFGDAVFVYEPDRFDEELGGATPFDTGGLYKRLIAADGTASDEERRAFVQTQNVPLSGWRRKFRRYVSTYFESAKCYVRGDRPLKDDRSRRFSRATDRRAWTWELRLERDHPVFEHLRRAYLSHDYAEALRERLRLEATETIEVWSQRFQSGIIWAVELGDCPHAEAIEQITQDVS